MCNYEIKQSCFFGTILLADSETTFLVGGLLQVGVKGNPKGVNKGLDCDVIVAEVMRVLCAYVRSWS